MAGPFLVISCSLSPASRSRVLARYACDRLQDAAHAADLIDLAELGLPVCDGQEIGNQPGVEMLQRRIRDAQGILLAFPIYNYTAGAAAKNLIELTGPAWEGKVVAMACAAGAVSSYMAPMNLAQSLILDFHCYILPRFVLATPRAFSESQLIDPAIRARMDALAAELPRVALALRGAGGE